MKLKFTISLLKHGTIYALPAAWGSQSYVELLGLLDYEDDFSQLQEGELRDLCHMALTDFEPEEAAARVLKQLLGHKLSHSQITSIAEEMKDEKLWEEYADLSLHETFFNAHQLLYDAFGKGFPRPEAFRFVVQVAAAQQRDLQVFDSTPEIPLIQLLAQGMPANTKINRLYEDELKSGAFNDAVNIIWQLGRKELSPLILEFEAISSHYWFADLRQAGEFAAILDRNDP